MKVVDRECRARTAGRTVEGHLISPKCLLYEFGLWHWWGLLNGNCTTVAENPSSERYIDSPSSASVSYRMYTGTFWVIERRKYALPAGRSMNQTTDVPLYVVDSDRFWYIVQHCVLEWRKVLSVDWMIWLDCMRIWHHVCDQGLQWSWAICLCAVNGRIR